MANKITKDLKMNIKLQLQNAQQFEKEIDKILKDFDFGSKMNNQFTAAKSKAAEIVKTLAKGSKVGMISDKDLTLVQKASDALKDLISKTDNLYKDLSNSGLNKFSKDYIAQMKKQAAEIEKIKINFGKNSGLDYDKEAAKLKTYQAELKNLQNNYNELAAINIDTLKANKIEEANKKLQVNKQLQQQLLTILKESQKVYNQSKKDSLSNLGVTEDQWNKAKAPKKSLEETLNSKELAEQKKLQQNINSQQKELKQLQKEIKKANEEDLTVINAKKESVAALTKSIKEQQRLLESSLNGTATLINLEKETRLYQQQLDITNAQTAALAQKNAYVQQNSKYQSTSSVQAQLTKLSNEQATIEATTDDAGITAEAQAEYNKIQTLLGAVNTSITSLSTTIQNILQATNRIALLEERAPTGEDVTQGTQNINANTNQDGNTSRNKIDAQTVTLQRDIAGAKFTETQQDIFDLNAGFQSILEPSRFLSGFSWAEGLDSQVIVKALEETVGSADRDFATGINNLYDAVKASTALLDPTVSNEQKNAVMEQLLALLSEARGNLGQGYQQAENLLKNGGTVNGLVPREGAYEELVDQRTGAFSSIDALQRKIQESLMTTQKIRYKYIYFS